MIARLPRFLIALALACSIGLHWAFLQSVAWIGMVITYAENAPLTQALAKTFDGQHPCCLCKEIAKSKQAEKKREFQPQWNKFEFSYARAAFIFRAPTRFDLLPQAEPRAEIRNYSPPVPPPRSLFA